MVVFLGFTVELDELAGEALDARDGLLVFLVLLSDELVDLVVVDEVVEVVLLVLPEFVFVEFDVLVPLDSERAFLSALILCAFTPARVASTGAENILITEATSIAQKNEALEGLYPRRRGMLIDVR